MKKKLAALLISTIATTAMPAFAATYTDVKTGDWYYSTVTSLSDKNIIAGYKDGSFKPNATITGAEFVKLVVTALVYTDIQPSSNGFWADTFIAKAKSLGLVKDGELDYTQNIDREHMALIISRALSNEDAAAFDMFPNGIDQNTEVGQALNKLIDGLWGNGGDTMTLWPSDTVYGNKTGNMHYLYGELKTGKISANTVKQAAALYNWGGYYFQDWNDIAYSNSDNKFKTYGVQYKEQFNKVLGLGIMSGYPDKTLRPQGNATRAEASSMVARMIDPSARVENKFELLTGKEADYYKVNENAPLTTVFENAGDTNISSRADVAAALKAIGSTAKVYARDKEDVTPLLGIDSKDGTVMTVNCTTYSQLNHDYTSRFGDKITMTTDGGLGQVDLTLSNHGTNVVLKAGEKINYTVTLTKNGKSSTFNYVLTVSNYAAGNTEHS